MYIYKVSKDEIILQKDRQIKTLQDEVAYFKKMIFAFKSERYISNADSNQLELFDKQKEDTVEQESDITEQVTYTRKKKKHPGRNKLPDHLPVEEIIIEPQEDTSGLKKIGEEITESLKYTPASLVMLRYIRPKYEKADKQGLLIAPMPNRLIHKCIAEPSLLSHILVAKFIDHLPFYRQIQRFKRDYDWTLSSSTMNDWFAACCTLLKPVYDAMVARIRNSNYIQVDESPIKVLESEKKKQTHQGYMWVYHSPQDKTIVFNYRKGRGMQGPKEFLEDYEGYLQCDGYTVYDKLGIKANINLVGCLTHARRYFYEAIDNDNEKADYAMRIFTKIYNLERDWKTEQVDVIYNNRQAQIKPLLKQLKDWCDEQVNIVLPKSKIGKAVRYYINQYHKLTAVTHEDFLEIDNNLIENKIRPLALGRKNYLFAGSHNSAQKIAIMYSLFASCKAKDINPHVLLNETFLKLTDPDFSDFDSLTP